MRPRLGIFGVFALFVFPSLVTGQRQAASSSLAQAVRSETLLSSLAGTWRFQMFSADRADPVGTGQRVMQLMSDSTKIAWSETRDGQSDIGTGILGHNSNTGTYYLLGTYTHDPNPIVLVGIVGDSNRTIAFEPVPSTFGFTPAGVFTTSELRFVNANTFEWIAADRSWHVLFTRTGRP